MKRLRLGTRGSRLAQVQAQEVAQALARLYPDLVVQTKILRTGGDRHRNQRVEELGPGAFVRELETALLEGSIDLAVHSLKDLPTRSPAELELAAIPSRCEPREALVSGAGQHLQELPPGARVGTSSLRRQAQLRAARADLKILPLRGNVNTRVLKVKNGDLDAAVLAAAGLVRLQMQGEISQYLDPEEFPPAPGQGCLAVQLRSERQELAELLSGLDDPAARAQSTAERAVLATLEGGCLAPLGAWAEQSSPGQLALSAVLADPATGGRLWAQKRARIAQARELGVSVGRELLAQGAGDILARLRWEEEKSRE